ncbi:ATP synthase subunit I [Novosphingobium sp.]|uniref:N-ATPase subunit AtpR n=1 Tax=Novosphingobium sp. TaxID=1874826 RepID=UPI003B5207E4
MTEFVTLALSLAAGLLLGAFFFGGLWWTVVKGLASPNPALLFLGSMVLRMAVLLAGLALIGRDDWRNWSLCLLGIVLARMAVKQWTRPSAAPTDMAERQARHAP